MAIGMSPTLEQIRAEYGGGYPIYLSNYYRGGPYVTGYAWGDGGYGPIPTEGYIDLSRFRNRQVIRMVINNHAGHGVNIRALAAEYGYQGGIGHIELTINPGVYVFGPDTNTAALRTGGNWGAGTTIYIVNHGLIIGRGGAGGAGGTANNVPGGTGGYGGIAFLADDACIFHNAGVIAGGGGGGGGGGFGTYTTGDGSSSEGGDGGYVTNPLTGSGGGGGRVHGAGGPGRYAGGGANYDSPGVGGGAGTSGAGGTGGQYGDNGAAGVASTTAGGAGGSVGFGVMNNGNISWANRGDVRGQQS